MTIAQWIVIVYFSLARCSVGTCEIGVTGVIAPGFEWRINTPRIYSDAGDGRGRYYATMAVFSVGPLFVAVSTPEPDEASMERTGRVVAAMNAYADPGWEQRRQLKRDQSIVDGIDSVINKLHGK
jgi:hypothetical protein